MKKNFISNSSDSVRMFQNNMLERLSKVDFFVPLIVFIPVIVFLGWKCLIQLNMTILPFVGYVVVGLFIWTFTEYVLHRFVFHFYPKSAWGQRIHFIFHGVHHDYPNDAKRLVIPPSASVPLALAFFFLFKAILPEASLFPIFLGFITGYLIYDIGHYALHHANFKSPFLKRLKQHHMLHHYSDPTKGFGVSSNFWDSIFRSNISKK
ncbi:MAG: fatty acid hydroxylase [Pedobacter sp.]|jgi:sterol desaturase/sphingolipid hydroxylase (fatty acid hydroxylase superfamily)|nr:fatty acid hydroxylase [Pedobacter sp.]